MLEIVELMRNFALNWMLKVSAVLSFSSFFFRNFVFVVIMIKQQVHKRPEFPFKYMTFSILCDDQDLTMTLKRGSPNIVMIKIKGI